MLKVSSRTSHPQPKPHGKPMPTVNDATSLAVLTVNDG
jgi:hypothetical protein